MNFAAIAVGAGIAGALFVAYLQGPPTPELTRLETPVTLDRTVTGSIKPVRSVATAVAATAPASLRLIDLRSGATCKIADPDKLGPNFAPANLGPDCANSPDLGPVAQWRAGEDGALEMADGQGETILKFMPGDGVLYESIYPEGAMVTIVPARG